MGGTSLEGTEAVRGRAGALRKDDHREAVLEVPRTGVHELQSVFAADVTSCAGGWAEDRVVMKVLLHNAIGLRHVCDQDQGVDERGMVGDDQDAWLAKLFGLREVEPKDSGRTQEKQEETGAVVDGPLGSKCANARAPRSES